MKDNNAYRNCIAHCQQNGDFNTYHMKTIALGDKILNISFKSISLFSKNYNETKLGAKGRL
jgi:hypothetical protein